MSRFLRILALVIALLLIMPDFTVISRGVDLTASNGPIYFSSNRKYSRTGFFSRGIPGVFTAFVMDTNGNEVAFISDFWTVLNALTWSPDGKTAAVETFYGEDDPTHCIVLVNAQSKRCLVPYGSQPSWSGSGQYLVYSEVGTTGVAPRPGAVYVAQVADGTTRQIASLPAEQRRATGATWSPDDTRIVYDQREATGFYSIQLISAVGGTPVFLTMGESPQWSPVRNEIAFISTKGLEIYELDSRSQHVVVDDSTARAPVWSPDGQQLLYTIKSGDSCDIYRMNRDGSNRVNLTHGIGCNYAMSWRTPH